MRRQTISTLTAVSFFGLTAVTTQLLVQRVHTRKPGHNYANIVQVPVGNQHKRTLLSIPIMLATEFTYFLEHRAELLAQYLNKHIVIKDGQVLASFDTEAEGYIYVVDNGLLGTALLQLCSPNESSYVQYVRPRNTTVQPETSVGATNGGKLTTITSRDDMPSYGQGIRVQAKLRQTEENLRQLSKESLDKLLALRKPAGG